ncbi:MAG TPA: ABC transporter, partial [Lachnospiraceae bacterium]|nr:ABC transporter [Lachnospiraceae bacterium]
NVDIQSMNLLNYDAIPEDAAGIIVLAPTSDYSEEDAQKVSDYLDNGGKAIFITSWTQEGLPEFTGIFEKYGMTLAEGIVVDPEANYYYQNPYYLLPDVSGSTITSSLVSDKRMVFIPYAQGITVEDTKEDDESDDAPDIKQIFKTSDKAYSKTDVHDMQTWEKEDGDVEGPFALGVYVTQSVGDEEMKFLWITSENFISENVNATVAGSNFELITNMVSQMTEHETSVSIPVKDYEAANLTVPKSVFFAGGAVVMLLIPLITLVAGFMIWFSRKKK